MMRRLLRSPRNIRGRRDLLAAGPMLALALALALPPLHAAAAVPQIRDRSIAYVMTWLYWGIHQSADGKAECPRGYNDGPREQYAALFPGNGRGHSIVETQLRLESETWFPSGMPDPTPFKEAGGTLGIGLNLDGKAGPHDFTSPEGEPGIDNQLQRALGCIIGFRGPDGVEYIFEPKEIRDSRFNRTLIEITGLDDLVNDPDVTVTFYRGLDRLLTDASGNNALPGGSQRLDLRFGKPFIRKMHGRIRDGVLTTDPIADLLLPWTTLDEAPTEIVRDVRFRLKLTPTAAEGLIGGYADVESWYKLMLHNDSTHHLSNGQISAISLYKALRRLADAHPDATGANTAISASLVAKMVQVYVQRPQP